MNTVAVSTLHNAPPGPRWTRLAWDRHQFETYLEAAKLDFDLEARAELAFKNILRDTTGPVNQAVFIGDKEDALIGSLYVIAIHDKADAFHYLNDWIEAIRGNEHWASGDDSAYDYAPDEAHLIHQIATHFNLQKTYELFYHWASEQWYKDDQEEFKGCFLAPSS